MKVTFGTEELQKVLGQLAAVISKKATSPVYEHVRLEVQPSADPNVFAISLGVADIDASLTRYLAAASADGPGTVLLPFGQLQNLSGFVPAAEPIIITADETKAIFKAGKAKAQLKTHPVADWPQGMDRPTDTKATLGLPGLKDQLEKVYFALPDETNKFVVCVSKIESNGEELRVVATDGFKLAVAISKQNAGTFELQLPKTAMDHLKKLEGTSVAILESEAGFFFETESEVLTVTRIAGTFPNYRRILPTAHATELVLEKGALQAATNFVGVLADKETPVIVFAVEENGNTLFMNAQSNNATPSAGEAGGAFVNVADNEINTTVKGPAQKFPLNFKFLKGFIERATGPIETYISAGHTIVEFRANGGLYLYYQQQAH
jgi:DNA polymerase-3 subunit beta